MVKGLQTDGHNRFCARYQLAKDDDIRLRIVHFAAEKLLNTTHPTGPLTSAQKLACLSQRLPIEFHSTTYTARYQEQKQVESHMRVCIKVLPSFESMVTTSPSEPILSEAAYGVMSRPDFDAPKALQQVMSGFSVNRGDRGEFVVMLLFTLARDLAVASQTSQPAKSRIIAVTDLLQNLFSQSRTIMSALPSNIHHSQTHFSKTKLKEAFRDAQIHFNHFVKVHQRSILSRKYLFWLISRGAAVLCANGQAGVDGLIPFTYRKTGLQIKDIGVILWQSKNDSSYTSEPVQALFDAMDPFDLGIFEESDQTDVIPIIRIVFALAAKTPSMKVVRAETMSHSCTAYDIWCSGISSEIQRPITNAAEEVWHSLVSASHGWNEIYNVCDQETKALRMSMNPGTAEVPSFWAAWT